MQVLPGDPFGLGGDGLGLDADRETSFVGAVLIPMKTVRSHHRPEHNID